MTAATLIEIEMIAELTIGDRSIAAMIVDRLVRPRAPMIAVARRQQSVMIAELALRVLITGEARRPIDDSIDPRHVLTIAADRLGWWIETAVDRKVHRRDSNRDDPTIAISVGSAGPTSNVTIVEDRDRNGAIRVAEPDLAADRNEVSTQVGHADTMVKPSASALVVNSAGKAQQWGEVASPTEAAQAPIVVRGHSAIADQQCTAALNTTGSVLRRAMRADLSCRAEGIDSLAE